MKNTLFVILLVLFTGYVSGQEIVYHQGENVNKKMVDPKVCHFLPGPDENKFLLVEPECRGWGYNDNGKSIMVRLVDSEWNEFKKTKIANSKANTIHAAFCTDNVLHVVLGTISKNRREHLFRHVTFDKSTLEILSDSVLVKIQREFEQNLESWCAVSYDNRYLGVVFTIHSKKDEPLRTEAILFDANMKRQWQKPIRYDRVEKLLVTDSGDIVTACIAYKDKQEDSLFLFCNVVNSEETLYAKFPADPRWEQLSLLKYYEGMVVASVLESDQAKNKDIKRFFTGFHTFLLDMDYAKIEVHDAVVFDENDYRLFNNSNARTGAETVATDRIRVREVIPTPQGAVVLLQRLLYAEFYDARTGESSTSIHSYGMMLVHVDSTADIMWTRGIMNNLFYATDPLKYRSLFWHKGRLYLVNTESLDASDTYDPYTPVKLPDEKKELIRYPTIYSIDAVNGDVSKKVLIRDGVHDQFSSVFSVGENKYLYTTAKFWPQISTLTFHD